MAVLPQPFVLGPDNVPVIATRQEAERDSAAALVQFVDSCLTDPQAQRMWRDLMTAMQYFWRHPLAEEVREQGREEGREEGRVADRADMTLRILEWRGISVPDAVRERVMSCSDLDQLTAWSQRAVHATTADDLFADPNG